MSGSIFLDTNVLVYAYSEDDLVKRGQALSISAVPERWISTQVLIEFVNVFHRKLRVPWPDIQISLLEISSELNVHKNSAGTIAQATRLAQRYGFSWFDALIVAAALECGCETLYSEDLQHGQLIEQSLRVVNPFRV